eukprot:1157703-Pelagomonas_calceolata.AAC.11
MADDCYQSWGYTNWTGVVTGTYLLQLSCPCRQASFASAKLPFVGRPQCFRSAALVGGYRDATSPTLPT